MKRVFPIIVIAIGLLFFAGIGYFVNLHGVRLFPSKITKESRDSVKSDIKNGNCEQGVLQEEIIGIDVSHHQGDIDWEMVKQEHPNLAFVYVKCTEGKSYVDPKFKINADGAAAQGFKVGAYHYYRMTSSAHEQYENFKAQLVAVHIGLIPMVDVERSDGKPRKELQDSLQVLLDLLEKEYGKKPMIYGTNRSYNEFCAPEFNHYPMYIGRYGSKPPVVTGPSHYTIWQYSESTSINGIPKAVDMCKFHSECAVQSIEL